MNHTKMMTMNFSKTNLSTTPRSTKRSRFYKRSNHILIIHSCSIALHLLFALSFGCCFSLSTSSSLPSSSLASGLSSSSSASSSLSSPSTPLKLSNISDFNHFMKTIHKHMSMRGGKPHPHVLNIPPPLLTSTPPPTTQKPLPPFNSSEIRIGYLTSLERKEGATYIPPGQLISGAFTYAVEKINKDPTLLPNHTLVYEIAETYGQEEDSLRETALFIQDGIHAIIGPQETCLHEGRLAAAFNVPMISYYCTDAAVSDPVLYPTFARTKPTDFQISGSVVSILKLFGWNRVTFIHNQDDEYNITADTIYDLMQTHDITVTYRRSYEGPYFHSHQQNPFIKIVSDTRHDTRIYVMLGDPYEFVGLMDHLQDLGLLDTGDYFVVGVTRDTYNVDSPFEFLQGIFDLKVTNRSMLAYRHFLSIIHTPPLDPKYKEFKETVDEYLEMPPFNITNMYKHANGTRDIRPEAVYLYDAVHIYANVVHQILQEGKDPRDGREVIGRIQGIEYKSAYGYLSKINDKGDALGNFSVIVRKHTPDSKEKWGMYPVGTFRVGHNGGPLPEFYFHKGESIRWINGAPPLDEPKCGFHNERCIPGETYTTEIAGTVVGGIIFIIIIIGYIVYNNWRYEQELAGLLWKIDYYKDIEFKTHSYNGNSNAQNSKSPLKKSASQSSLISATDIDLRQLFTHVGIYKGTLVAVKHLNKTHVELTRSIKKELKTVKELRHDNINPFIGACVEPMQIAIVTAYCSKGSLQDILENEDIQLDGMFTASLIFDIIKGMIYLHGSEIISHGRLKSSNCIVDSRWVLKITDYGLHGFTAGGQQPQGEYAYYRNLLCRSPELLRQKNARSRGCQEGDVYSFAILLFEIQSRNGPYGQCELTPKEIVERVASVNVTGQPFRPRLSEISSTPKFITDVIKQSWDEDPNKRPDFKSLRTMMKPMQKGLKSNIFDNMMAMMEKYASNLESLVQSRTDELIEEKKKTEELLQDMLPGTNAILDEKKMTKRQLQKVLPETVADQLMHGKQVEAEGFDYVTIYFSDICGFTALSAQSTPMQIVELLNSLYTLFDSLIDFYDVYKVETIGDAYMVVSGLPKRNGIKHAGEIASMSLNLLQELATFKIPHRENDRIMLRIGIHTGPVVAGVVGRKMPRYCLFGDTVNVASRMESNGQASKIHLSETTMSLLVEIGGFELQERGCVDVKGKGLMRTYWLMGEDPSRNHQRLQRGIARMERSGSTRRRNNKMPDAVLRVDGSPQLSHHSNLIKSQSGGNYPLESPSFRNQNHLHPFSHIVGPTSHDLIRRTSSRRRRLQFQIKNDVKDDSSSGDEKDLGPPEFTADTLPTIIRSKSEKDCCELDEDLNLNSRSFSKNPPVLKASSDYSLTNHSDTSEVVMTELYQLNDDMRVESPSLNNILYNPQLTAPLFKIESFDGDVILDSVSCENVNVNNNHDHLPFADNEDNQNERNTDNKSGIPSKRNESNNMCTNNASNAVGRNIEPSPERFETPDLVNALRRVNGISTSYSNGITSYASTNQDTCRNPGVSDSGSLGNLGTKCSPPQYSSIYPHSFELHELASKSQNSQGNGKNSLENSPHSHPLIENNRTNLISYPHDPHRSSTSQTSPYNSSRGKGSLVFPVSTDRSGGSSYSSLDKPVDEINAEGTPLLSDHDHHSGDGGGSISQLDSFA